MTLSPVQKARLRHQATIAAVAFVVTAGVILERRRVDKLVLGCYRLGWDDASDIAKKSVYDIGLFQADKNNEECLKAFQDGINYATQAMEAQG